MQKRPMIFAVIFAAVATVPATAQACRVSTSQTPILHDTVPPVAPGLIVAEVEITTEIHSVARPPLEARIISMIRGEYSGSHMRIEPQYFTSCDVFPSLGQRGIVVGRVLKIADDALVVDPVRAPSAAETRLESEKFRDAR